jgi:hypothetical protein
VLRDPGLSASLVDRAQRRIRGRYDWDAVGRRTVGVYEQAIAEETALTGEEPRRPLRALLHEAPILELDSAG